MRSRFSTDARLFCSLFSLTNVQAARHQERSVSYATSLSADTQALASQQLQPCTRVGSCERLISQLTSDSVSDEFRATGSLRELANADVKLTAPARFRTSELIVVAEEADSQSSHSAPKRKLRWLP